jgi:hypothetical protein
LIPREAFEYNIWKTSCFAFLEDAQRRQKKAPIVNTKVPQPEYSPALNHFQKYPLSFILPSLTECSSWSSARGDGLVGLLDAIHAHAHCALRQLGIDVLGFMGGTVMIKQILHLAWNGRCFDGFRRFSSRQPQREPTRMQGQTVKRTILSEVG